MIHLYASRPHYAQHLAPIFDALPPEVRGGRWAPREGCWWGSPGVGKPDGGLWLVASYTDARVLQDRALVYVEHGAGQTYPGDPRSVGHGAFSGGDGLDAVRLFLCPSETVADRWRARYPQAVAKAVGCPRLDRWHLSPPRPEGTIALTFHHPGGICRETTWALPHYRSQIGASVAAWRAEGYRVVGHGHPLAEASLRRLWAEHGVEWVTADVLFDEASVLVADNTSLAWEFMSTGRPVVWLDAPWYRPHIRHGLRFWDHADSAIRIQDPADLTGAVYRALDDPPEIRTARKAAVAYVYAHTDGHAAERAAAAIVALVG